MPDLSCIRPNLYVGSALRSRAEIEELLAHNITAVLSLQTDDDLAKDGLRWEQIEEWYLSAGIGARRVQIHDYSAEAVITNLNAAVTSLRTLLDQGHTVYLHCTAGVNRSPTIAIAYLVRAEGRSVDEALDLVKNARYNVEPYRQALAHLRTWEIGWSAMEGCSSADQEN